MPHLARQENPDVGAAFGEEFALFSITDGQCSCHLYDSPAAAEREPDHARRRKYERRGWSQARIERALAAAEQAAALPDRGVKENAAALIADLAERFGEVRLLVHEYRGSFAEERVRAHGEERISAAELRGAGRHRIELDTIYVIG